jgi:2-amino-4-hydroxy-6-hydroxymethyldihydropteridine diphosphokinase
MHAAILLIGSNISPEENLPISIALLQEYCKVQSVSGIWETQAVGTPGPNFLNTAVLVETGFDPEDFKWQVLRVIEQAMGRIRTPDKNAPRTIDIDIVIWDGEVVDTNLWTRAYIALPVSSLVPQLVNPETGESLPEIAGQLQENAQAILRPELGSE